MSCKEEGLFIGVYGISLLVSGLFKVVFLSLDVGGVIITERFWYEQGVEFCLMHVFDCMV